MFQSVMKLAGQEPDKNAYRLNLSADRSLGRMTSLKILFVDVTIFVIYTFGYEM